MHLFSSRLVVSALFAAASVVSQTLAAQSARVEGCYRASRPLGTSAASAYGHAVAGDVGRRIGEDSVGLSHLTTFRLLPGGRAERPGTALSRQWAEGSKWVTVGDTLRVTLSTRTSGWALRLVSARADTEGTYVGVARYLTDVVVADTSASHVPEVFVRVQRQDCVPPAPAAAKSLQIPALESPPRL